jgi:hypothetical protein
MKIHCILLLAAVATCAASACDRRPSRSECIVKVQVSPAPDGRIPDVALRKIFPSARSIHAPLAGYAVHGQNVFLQFTEQCQNRKLLAESIADSAGLELAAPIQLEQIQPGPQTAAISGDSWRD